MKRSVTLIQQNDTHAQLDLHWEYFWEGGKPVYRGAGGFPRIATLVKQLRERSAGASLFVDCGDEIHGTGVAQWTKGAAVVPLLNALGIDVMVPGNWEFGFGPEVLRERVAEMNFPVLACNVQNAVTTSLEFPPYIVREVGGLRLGLLGLTSPIVVERMPSAFGRGLRFLDAAEALPAHVDKLRRSEKVDLVVLISHMGLPQDMKLAGAVEGIDVVLSGHTHDRISMPVLVGRTILIQSGFSGSFLGCLTLGVEGGRVCDFQHELIEVRESLTPDPEVQSILDRQMEPFRERLKEVVGRTATHLHRMAVLETPMDNLITRSYLALTGADVSFSHGWRYGAPVPAGEMTIGDLWQIIPVNPEVFTAKMTGQQIRRLLEQSFESVYAPDPLRQKGGYPARVSGLSAVVRINNPKGARIQQLEIGGAPFQPERTYVVAGAGEQDLAGVEDRRGTGASAIDAIRRYLKHHDPVHEEISNAAFIAI